MYFSFNFGTYIVHLFVKLLERYELLVFTIFIHLAKTNGKLNFHRENKW